MSQVSCRISPQLFSVAVAVVITWTAVATAQDTPAAKPAAQVTAQQSPNLPSDTRPQYWFGVAVENIPPAFAKQFKLQPDQGVMVVAVFPDSPASKAGLKEEDILIEINDKPLTSQDDLASAANKIGPDKVGANKAVPSMMQESQIEYLRDGERHGTKLTPELRPANMVVSGPNIQHFTPGNQAVTRTPEVRTMVLSGGASVQYGPGYQFDGNSQGSMVTVLREAVSKNQSVIVSQETDEAGNTVTKISDGKKAYVVDAGKLDQIPASLKPIAQKLLEDQKALASQNAPVDAITGTVTTDDRLIRLEKQNEALRQQLDDTRKQLDQTNKQLDELIVILKASQAPRPAPAAANSGYQQN